MRKYLCAHNPHNNAHILVRRHWCLKNSSHPRVKKKRGIRNREIMEKGWKLAHFPSPHISEMEKKLKSLAYHREVDWLWLIQSAFFLLSNEYIFTKITFDTKHLKNLLMKQKPLSSCTLSQTFIFGPKTNFLKNSQSSQSEILDRNETFEIVCHQKWGRECE